MCTKYDRRRAKCNRWHIDSCIAGASQWCGDNLSFEEKRRQEKMREKSEDDDESETFWFSAMFINALVGLLKPMQSETFSSDQTCWHRRYWFGKAEVHSCSYPNRFGRDDRSWHLLHSQLRCLLVFYSLFWSSAAHSRIAVNNGKSRLFGDVEFDRYQNIAS